MGKGLAQKDREALGNGRGRRKVGRNVWVKEVDEEHVGGTVLRQEGLVEVSNGK